MNLILFLKITLMGLYCSWGFYIVFKITNFVLNKYKNDVLMLMTMSTLGIIFIGTGYIIGLKIFK